MNCVLKRLVLALTSKFMPWDYKSVISVEVKVKELTTKFLIRIFASVKLKAKIINKYVCYRDLHH